jgi:diguanylate cyclase (GGDEF)-like protein
LSARAIRFPISSTDTDVQAAVVSDNDQRTGQCRTPLVAIIESSGAENILDPNHIAILERRKSRKPGAGEGALKEKTLPFLGDLLDRLGAVTDLEEMLSAVVAAIGKYLGVSCHYAEIDSNKRVAIIRADYCDGVSSMVGTHSLASFGRETVERLNRGAYIANEDTAADPSTAPLYETTYAPLELRSFLAVPFIKQGQYVAHIAVRHSKPRRWQVEEILLLQQVVERTSRALYNARVQRELRDRVCESETLFQTLPIGILDAYGQLEAHTAIVKNQHAELQLREADLEEANRQLAELAITDSLTGLKNHRTFQERVRDEVARAIRCDTPLSVLLLDIDNFKSYNDTFGHPAGDAALRGVAEILQVTARATDIVTRYGGEEFAIILVGTDTDSARVAAERFRAAIEAAHWPERQVTVSAGVASLFAPDVTELIESADKALYRSKKRGRNCITHSTDAVPTLDTIEDSLQSVHDTMVESVRKHLREQAGKRFDPGAVEMFLAEIS